MGMTSFLDMCIVQKILRIKMIKYSNLLHEMDNYKDIKITEQELS